MGKPNRPLARLLNQSARRVAQLPRRLGAAFLGFSPAFILGQPRLPQPIGERGFVKVVTLKQKCHEN
jgi:hypothetical protein